MYVRDWIVIALRSAPQETSRQVGQASTGERVEVLEEIGGWSRVRLASGIEGWTPARYLSPKPPAASTVSLLEQRIRELQAELARLKGIQPPSGAAAGQTSVATTNGTAPGFEDAAALRSSRERLKAQLELCVKQKDELEEENSRLRNSERLFFTFIGGLFIVLGVIIGIFIQLAGGRFRKQGYRF